MNTRGIITITSLFLMVMLLWLGSGTQNPKCAAKSECPVCPATPAVSAAVVSQPQPVAASTTREVYSPQETFYTPYELYVLPEDRASAMVAESDISGRTLWWSLDAIHSMRPLVFNADKTVHDQTGWYQGDNALKTWSVENNKIMIAKQNGKFLTLKKVNPVAPDQSDLILVQDVNPNFEIGTGKYAPEVGRSPHPLCKSGWVHGSGNSCYRLVKRGPDFCKKLDQSSTSTVELKTDITIIQNILRRQRRMFAVAADTNQKISVDKSDFETYSPSDEIPTYVCSIKKHTDRSLPSDIDSKRQAYSQALPVGAHEIFPHALLNTREGLGDLLEIEDFKTAIEIGVQSGAFSDKILRSWKSVEKYHLVDPWETQRNYEDVANVGQSEQDKLMNYVRDRFSIYEGRVIQIRKYSQDAVSMFENGSIDFIFVDARHDYSAVLEDITLYWPKCRKGGIMAGHDYLYAAEAAKTNQKWQIQGDGSSHIGGPRMAAEHFASSVGRELTITREMPTWNGVAFRSWLIRC